MDISVIIVNYNVKYYLEQALLSIKEAAKDFETEYIVVDNASQDGSAEYVRQNFPWVQLIANNDNVGFGRANNQGLKLAKGRYLLVLNPDTVVSEDSLKLLIEYMDSHTDIGAITPKLLDKEGRLEASCRRGFPSPFASFSKITGLASIFPKSRLFAQYTLTYLDPDLPHDVDSICGAFMLVRREVYLKVGGFDEDYFMYGEDVDWSYRIKLAGWRIFYLPEAQVIHYKGESSLRSPIDTRRAFYNAMHLFVKKHFARKTQYTLALIRLGIVLSEIIDWVKRYYTRLKAPAADILLLNIGISLGRLVKYGPQSIVHPKIVVPNLIYSLGLAGLFAALGVYGKKKYSLNTVFLAAMAGSAFIFTFTYFFKQYAFSRLVLLVTAVFIAIALPGWRWMLRKFTRTGGFREWFKRRALLVGVDELTERIAAKAAVEAGYPFKVIGFIETSHRFLGEKRGGVEVIGSSDELSRLIKKLDIEEVVFSGKSLSYGEIMKYVGQLGGNVGFKVVPESALESANGEMPFLELGFIRKPKILSRLKDITG